MFIYLGSNVAVDGVIDGEVKFGINEVGKMCEGR